ncbi:MAG: ABC transporter ATP-binding protein, partial [Jiangellaceae bacterium]
MALQPCDLVVQRGEMVTIVGPSGSGKSTLLNILGLLDRPSRGDYVLDGVDTTAIGEADRAAIRGTKVGFIFQSFHLLPHRSAAENVALGLLYTGAAFRSRMASAHAALDAVGLSHRADAPPSQLSGGERQRVAIARALVHQPALLL